MTTKADNNVRPLMMPFITPSRSIGHRKSASTLLCLWPSVQSDSRCSLLTGWSFLCLFSRCFVVLLSVYFPGGSSPVLVMLGHYPDNILFFKIVFFITVAFFGGYVRLGTGLDFFTMEALAKSPKVELLFFIFYSSDWISGLSTNSTTECKTASRAPHLTLRTTVLYGYLALSNKKKNS